jgi:hypothetical protein
VRTPAFLALSSSLAALTLLPLGILAQNAADDDVILKAMRDEMERSRQLRVVGGQDLPYFFAYDFTDSYNFRVNASMGSAVDVTQSHLRFPSVEVRVGGYDFDNTGHVYSGIYSGSRYDQSWPLDDDYAALRESFWLATDRAYKAALESMGRKRATINAASAQTDKLPDFSKVEPVVNLPKVAHTKLDEDAWSARVKRLSSVFNGYPEVLTSQVEMQSVDGVTYYVTSEGTALRYADKVSC